MVTCLLTALIVFAVYCVACVFTRRFIAKRPVANLAIVYFCCMPLLYFVFPFVEQANLDRIVDARIQLVLLGIFLLIAAYAFFIQVYGLIEWSISFRVLYEVLRSPGHSITPEELQKAYPFEEVINRKLGYGIDMGLIKEKELNGKRVLANTPFWTFVGHFSTWLLRFMGWGTGG